MHTEPGLTRRLAEWARSVRYEDIPPATVAAARSQIISHLGAVQASLAHPAGRGIVAAFGSPVRSDPRQAAYVLAALATILDYDEVSYVGHVSIGAVGVALTESRVNGLDGRRLLAAVVAANECAARVTASTVLGPFFRGQTNTHCFLVGAAVARLHARDADLDEWVRALGLALGVVPTAIHHGVIVGDGKAFTAAAPVRLALDACDAAAAGLGGAPRILEHADGVLAKLAAVPVPETITEGLGRRWHTDTLTYKRFPGSAYLHAAFDCAQRLHRRLGAVDPDRIRRVVVHGSILTWLLEHKIAGYLDGPRTGTGAAILSVGYGVATLLRTGRLEAEDFRAPALTDTERWAVADKVTVEHDMALSEAMIRATSPLGQAIRHAGERALDWPELRMWGGDRLAERLAELGPPEPTFARATMAIGARVEIEMRDGTVEYETCATPIGAAGDATRRDHAAIVRDKYLRAGGVAAALPDLERLDELGPPEVARLLERSLHLDEIGCPA
ncbi:MmgE/PrpD family protein [Nocardia sp. NPDC003482]